MDKKNVKKVYSKPIVQKPKEEVIKKQVEVIKEEQVEEIVEAKPVDPAVFETKLFVEEKSEEFVEISGEEKLVEEPVTVVSSSMGVDVEAEMTKTIQVEMGGKSYGIDAVEEIRKKYTTPEPEKKVKEVNKKIEEFQTIQVVPVTPEPEPEPMYTLTPEQEEEGAQAVAEMVDKQILAELKELTLEQPKDNVSKEVEGEYLLTEKQAKDKAITFSPEFSKEKIFDTLSQHDLRHFKRTDQMPK